MKQTYTIRLNTRIHKLLKEHAKVQGCSLSEIVEDALLGVYQFDVEGADTADAHAPHAAEHAPHAPENTHEHTPTT